MSEKKNVLIGIDDFKKLINSNGYYIDKTKLIMGLIDRPNEVTLFSRPRRFGKTLNMSMLKYFFEVTKGRQLERETGDVKYLFKGLQVSEGDKYMKHQGTYPVVYMTFKNAKQDNWEETYSNLKKIIGEEYRRHRYILDKNILSEEEVRIYTDIMDLNANTVDYTSSIKNLTNYLGKYYDKKCIVLIDEYDTPIQAGYLDGYYDEVMRFINAIFLAGLKGNPNVHQGVICGITKVSHESEFSDFNNPTLSSLISTQYTESFGFTEEEVKAMAKYFDLEDSLEDIKDWYDGYIFGTDTKIYNPWSIINFMAYPTDGLRPYWINTSSNRIVKEVMQLDKKEGKEVVEKLLKGEPVRKVIEENIIYQNIRSHPNVAWSFLLHAGYLKASDREMVRNRYEYALSIPNKEVGFIYENMLKEWFEDDIKLSMDVIALIDALEGDIEEKFEESLQYIYMKYVSYNDVKVESLRYVEQEIRQENFHHGIMLGLMIYAQPKYEVYSNREHGFGRPDILIVSNDRTKAFVFEFKWGSVNGKKTIEELNKDAKDQIKDKKYIEGVKATYGVKEVLGIGIGFRGKELKISYVK